MLDKDVELLLVLKYGTKQALIDLWLSDYVIKDWDLQKDAIVFRWYTTTIFGDISEE